jgi:hypothetical protein
MSETIPLQYSSFSETTESLQVSQRNCLSPWNLPGVSGGSAGRLGGPGTGPRTRRHGVKKNATDRIPGARERSRPGKTAFYGFHQDRRAIPSGLRPHNRPEIPVGSPNDSMCALTENRLLALSVSERGGPRDRLKNAESTSADACTEENTLFSRELGSWPAN